MIASIIPSQSFELIRDRIGDILSNEFANQFTLSANNDINVTVFLERQIPVDHTECPIMIVSFASSKLSGQTQISTDGSFIYNIDVYTNGDTDGSALIKLHKILGMARAILENSIYKTLSFAAPFIVSRFCTDIQIKDNSKSDLLHSAMGRLVFNVLAQEVSELKEVSTLASYQTIMKIEETELGYIYTQIE